MGAIFLPFRAPDTVPAGCRTITLTAPGSAKFTNAQLPTATRNNDRPLPLPNAPSPVTDRAE